MIKTHFSPKWASVSGTFFFGKAVLNGRYREHAEAVNTMNSWVSRESVISGLRNSSGFFAVCSCRRDFVWFAVDKVRSIPLFYALTNDTVYVSDDARWVREQVGEPLCDERAVREFLATGYVTGPNTLFHSVKQLQAGEVMFVEKVDGRIKLSPVSYYCFLREDIDDDTDVLLARMDSVLMLIFKRLVDWADGRTIVIPLSGGHDSRLIALMLKRLGYENVICFTYGRRYNWESAISRKVAQQLGYKWLYFEYKPRQWCQWLNSRDMGWYARYADGLCSLPHIQEWPAVREMRINGYIPEDSVFTPGHSADFVAGSHTPDQLLNLRFPTIDDVAAAILARHFCLNSGVSTGKDHWMNRVKEQLQGLPVGSPEEAVSAYEYWDWRERQAKFVCNSVRVYEFWGYEWMMPFWETEFVEFWQKVKLNQRLGERLYFRFFESNRIPPLRVSSCEVLIRKQLDRGLKAVLGWDLHGLLRTVRAQPIDERFGTPLDVNGYLAVLYAVRTTELTAR